MKQQPVTKVEEVYQVTAGSVLIAQPFWNEQIYRRSVILITDHDEYRTRGIILNKESETAIHSALPEIKAMKPVYFGGPLVKQMITCVHSNPRIPGSEYIGCGFYIGGDTADLRRMEQQNKTEFRKIRFCAGIVEWNAAQLHDELDERKWWIIKITAGELFNTPARRLWTYTLLQMDNYYGFTAHLSDPSFN